MKRTDTFIQADSMGLGKTAQAIEYMRQTTNCHFIVVCPSSLKSNWCYEINEWLGIKVEPDVYTGNIIVTNYERVGRMIDLIGDYVHNFKGVIFDEAHMVKNVYSGRTQEARRLVNIVGNPMLLTGTPILNKPNDLMGLLYVGGRLSEFGGVDGYTRRYIPHVEKDNAIFFYNVAHLDELRKKIAPMICRRRWCDVHRPEYHIEETEVSLGKFADYPLASVNITNIQKVESQVVERKLPLVIKWIKEHYEQNHEPLVIFANRRRMIDGIHEALPNSVVVYGGMTHKQQQDSIDTFTDGRTDIIICSLACASCGLNLTRSHCVVFAEFPWTTGIYEQSVARCARRGQTYHTVYVYALILENSYDRYRLEQMHWKSEIANAIIDGEEKQDGRYYTGCVSLGIYSYIEDGSVDTSTYHGIDVYSSRFAYALGAMCKDWILAHPKCTGNPNQYWDYTFRSYLQYSFTVINSKLLVGIDNTGQDEMTLIKLFNSLQPLSEMIDYNIDVLSKRKLWFDNVWEQYAYPYNSWFTVYRQQIHTK